MFYQGPGKAQVHCRGMSHLFVFHIGVDFMKFQLSF